MVKTLGPWYASANQFGYVTATDADGNPVTVCTTRTEADARLIAAAPELYEALKGVLIGDSQNYARGSREDKAWKAARAALAKVEA